MPILIQLQHISLFLFLLKRASMEVVYGSKNGTIFFKFNHLNNLNGQKKEKTNGKKSVH